MFRCLCLLLGMTAALNAGPLRVFCWNLHHGVGEDGKLDLERIAKVIREARPDLVALQEVDQRCARSGKVDQAAELARLTGMPGVFGKAMDYQGGAYGQAILSPHPIQNTKVHALPGTGEPRIAFEATVSIGGREMSLVSTHLDLDAKPRLAQAQTLARILAQLPRPVILCGDFNDVPGSPALKAFDGTLTFVPKKAPALTCPAGDPKSEIDHFLAKGFTTVSPPVVLPEAHASDHRPILGVFVRD